VTTKDQVAQLIVAEAKARNHTRDECLAEMSALYQESGWDETIWDPTHVTYGVAQQDGSYPNRFQGAAAQIKAFFDKLDVKRNHPGHGDIWLNICWLQQAPNWPSAQYWYDNGRRAYLTEIKSRIATVTPYLNKYWPTTGGATMPVTGDPVWLEDVLREALGDRLVVHEGWQDRGAGGTMGVIWGVMIHHTGNDNETVEVIRDGVQQPSGWLPGPLSQCLITRDGKCHLIAVGPCNHAGGGNWKDLDDGNGRAIGFECAYDGDPLRWPDVMVITMRDATAAVLKKIGKRADDAVCGHKEYAKPQGRKVDPANMSMDWFRGEVQKDLDGFVFPGEQPTTPQPHVQPINFEKEIWDQVRIAWPQLGDRTLVDAVAAIGEKLGVAGCYDVKAKK
jgi:hypothetical protein